MKKKYLFISIKENYAERILMGEKQIELRKSRPNVQPGDSVIIYCTSPVKSIVGVAKVKEILTMSPQRMWKLNSSVLGISKKDFNAYYEGLDKAVGIVLSDVQRLNKSIALTSIKQRLPKFSPPQTYKYFLDFQQSSTSFKIVPYC